MTIAESQRLSTLVSAAPADKTPEDILQQAGVTEDNEEFDKLLQETKNLMKEKFHVNGTSLARHKPDIWTSRHYLKAIRDLYEEMKERNETLTNLSYDAVAKGNSDYPSLSRITQVFGSWNNALEKADIPINRGGNKSGRKNGWTKDELLDFVISCAREVTKSDDPNYWHSLSKREYDAWRLRSIEPTEKGVWNPQIPSSAWLRTQVGRWVEIRTKAIERALSNRAAA